MVRIRGQETPWDEVRENPAPGGANQLSPARQRWEKVGEMIRVPEGRPSSHAHISRAVKTRDSYRSMLPQYAEKLSALDY